MKSNLVLSLLATLSITDYSHQQTTNIPNQPRCIHFPDALQCFQSFGKTTRFTDAKEICQSKKTDLPIIPVKSNRQIVVNSSIPLNMVPFWLDLKSLTQVNVFITGLNVEYLVCAVGRAPDKPMISFDYCLKKRRALCCKQLACNQTNAKFSWEEARAECHSNNQTMYGTGATLAEISERLPAMSFCPDCWIGLYTAVKSDGFKGSELVKPVPGLTSIPRPGPCAVVVQSGEGMSVPCEGNTSYHIICESYIKKHQLNSRNNNEVAKIKCPPGGCSKPYPQGGDTRMTSAIILTVGLPAFIVVGLVAGVVHRRRNPIYNPMRERRTSRSASQISYIPGGANTMF